VDVVSDYQRVIEKNGRHWIQCPFHGDGNEKTPSCILHIDKGSFYCFACHESGSMFDFIMKRENCTFPEAVEILAKKAGVTIEESTEKEKKALDEAKMLKELNSRIKNSFAYCLKSKGGQAAFDYIHKRAVTDETIEKFQIGFAPADPRWLYGFLKDKQHYSDEFLRKSGFFSVSKYPYPLFCNRLMFPVFSWQGDTLAFGGRDLSFRENAPKYLNTPDTLVYSKKHNLFGLYQSLETMKKSGEVTLCEGNFDVVSLHQAGITNAVAPFGTAFTVEQAKLLSRYVHTVNLLFDSDAAGQNATAKAIVMLQEAGLESRILKIEGAKDASEVLEKSGGEALKSMLNSTSTGFNYLVENVLKSYNIRTPKGKSDAVQAFKPFLYATSSSVEKEEYIKTISDYLNVGVDEIVHDINKGGRDLSRSMAAMPEEKAAEAIKARQLSQSSISPDLYCMLLLANNRELFPEYTKKIKFGDLTDEEAQSLYIALEDARRNESGKTDEIFLSSIHDSQLLYDVRLSFAMDEFKTEDADKIIGEILARIRLKKLETERRIICKQIMQLESENNDGAEIAELIQAKMEIDAEWSQVSEVLANRKDSK
jgi:DNA primase, catalytic core